MCALIKLKLKLTVNDVNLVKPLLRRNNTTTTNEQRMMNFDEFCVVFDDLMATL